MAQNNNIQKQKVQVILFRLVLLLAIFPVVLIGDNQNINIIIRLIMAIILVPLFLYNFLTIFFGILHILAFFYTFFSKKPKYDPIWSGRKNNSIQSISFNSNNGIITTYPSTILGNKTKKTSKKGSIKSYEKKIENAKKNGYKEISTDDYTPICILITNGKSFNWELRDKIESYIDGEFSNRSLGFNTGHDSEGYLFFDVLDTKLALEFIKKILKKENSLQHVSIGIGEKGGSFLNEYSVEYPTSKQGEIIKP